MKTVARRTSSTNTMSGNVNGYNTCFGIFLSITPLFFQLITRLFTSHFSCIAVWLFFLIAKGGCYLLLRRALLGYIFSISIFNDFRPCKHTCSDCRSRNIAPSMRVLLEDRCKAPRESKGSLCIFRSVLTLALDSVKLAHAFESFRLYQAAVHSYMSHVFRSSLFTIDWEH